MPDLSRSLRNAFARVVNRRSSVRRGRVEAILDFESKRLGNKRQISVYLPPGYDEHRERRYPVLYMQDGQNLFDDWRSFGGQSWHLQNAADEAIAARGLRPLIIAGVDHAGVDRVHEYTPVRDGAKDAGGRADDYGQMLVDELKPEIDRRYRTVAEESGIGGSSLGGLVALHLAITRPEVFRRAAVMSPSVWWGGRAIVREIEGLPPGPRQRIWLDIGGREGREAVSDARLLRARMLEHGWSEESLRFFEDRRADHSEQAWRARVRKVLEFLYPPE